MLNDYDLASQVAVEWYRRETGLDDFVNTYACKGPIIILGNPRYGEMHVWLDRKTAGYPNNGIVGKVIFRGGNWRLKEDKTPLDVYVRQLDEETRRLTDAAVPLDADRRIREEVLRKVQPFADYFTAVPTHLLQNPNLDKHRWYCDITSIFVSEIELEFLHQALDVPASEGIGGVNRVLNLISPEAGQEIVSVNDLVTGSHPLFGFGDDYKMKDVLQHLYGVDTAMSFVKGIEVIQLKTLPGCSFAEREGVNREGMLKYLRRDNHPLLKDEVAVGRVFREREDR